MNGEKRVCMALFIHALLWRHGCNSEVAFVTRWGFSFSNPNTPLEKDVWPKASCADGLAGRWWEPPLHLQHGLSLHLLSCSSQAASPSRGFLGVCNCIYRLQDKLSRLSACKLHANMSSPRTASVLMHLGTLMSSGLCLSIGISEWF